ncbi:YgjP-like metallopeptidase domain-containing protein [Kocuria kalidii]|uniref:M48 metallopeptidase family protein n=1 Tax=Kocuria kalidii TaxID=3376283 RepID=UPI00378CE63F
MPVPSQPEVVVRRSARRRKTVSAHWSEDTVVLSVPQSATRREIEHWTRELVPRVVERRRREAAKGADRRSGDRLLRRAEELSHRHLDGRARPSDVRWSARQHTRWGSATPATGVIRISAQLQDAPEWVLDFVLVHELAHLLEADHSPRFRELEARYPHAERARAFLDGAAWAHRDGGRAEEGQREPSPSCGSSPSGRPESSGPS